VKLAEPIMGSSHGTPFLGANEINEIWDIDTLWEWNLRCCAGEIWRIHYLWMI